VTVQGFAFAPQTLEVKAGAKVTWTNKDTAAHTATSGKPGTKDGKWEGQLAASSGTFSFTFAQAGTFEYFCAIHNRMTGSIVVR
jgi:plastocyanin